MDGPDEPASVPPDWAATIRLLRSQRQLSMEELARLLGVAYSTISRWEHRQAVPSARMIERLQSLVSVDAPPPTAVPAPAVADAPGVRLEQDRTPFIGRARELSDLGSVWPRYRLLTLTGPGGVGKTRLAAELLRRAAEPVLGVVRLDVVSDPALTGSAVALALAPPSGRRVSGTAAVAESLAAAQGVILLDTCEHVRDTVRDVVTDILATAPGVRLLATSQAPLGLAEERVWRVRPMDASTQDSDAIQLFLARTAECAPDFVSQHPDLDAVVDVCGRLQGVPLALNMAAAWMATMTPAQLLQRWEEHEELLTDTGAPVERQRTTSAAVTWSAALLDEADRSLVEELSAFTGPFTLEDVEAVATYSSRADLLARLRRLVELSWLDYIGADAPHYRMLEPLQAWGRSRLRELGRGDAVRERLARHIASVSAESEGSHFTAGILGDQQRRLDLIAGTIGATLRWLADTDSVLGAQIAVNLLRWWRSSGRLAEGQYWLDTTAALTGAPWAARARSAEALLLLDMGEYQAVRRLAEQALEELTDPTDDLWAARAHTAASSAAKYQGETSVAWAHLEEARVRLERWGDPRELAVALNNFGALAVEADDLAAAREFYTRSLWIKHGLGDSRSVAVTMANLADVEVKSGAVDDALDNLARALAIAASCNDPFLTTFIRINRGDALLAALDLDAALAEFSAARQSADELGVARFQALASCGMGQVLLAQGDTREALRHLRASRVVAERIGDEIVLAQIRRAMTDAVGGAEEVRPPRNLTAREVQVLRALMGGLSNHKIGEVLGIEDTTVQRHLANIFRKLDVASRTEAVVVAKDLGFRRA